MKSSSRSSGSPTSGSTIAVGPVGQHPRRDGAAVVGDQRHLGACRAVTSRDPADEAVAGDHGVVDLDPGARADVDRHRRVPDGRRAADHPRRSPARSRRAPRSRRRGRAACGTARSRPPPPAASTSSARSSATSARSSSFSPRASKVSSNQLTRSRAGFSARSAPSLDRREAPPRRRAGSSAAGRSRPREKLTREQHQRGDDQRHEDRPAPADLLAVHARPGQRRRARRRPVRVAVHPVDHLELLERAARSRPRRRSAATRSSWRGHLALLAHPLVHALQQRAAAGEGDAAVHDVAGELGRGAVERVLDRADDLADGLLERGADLARRSA